jgi:hypothetical protein
MSKLVKGARNLVGRLLGAKAVQAPALQQAPTAPTDAQIAASAAANAANQKIWGRKGRRSTILGTADVVPNQGQLTQKTLLGG